MKSVADLSGIPTLDSRVLVAPERCACRDVRAHSWARASGAEARVARSAEAWELRGRRAKRAPGASAQVGGRPAARSAQNAKRQPTFPWPASSRAEAW